MIKGAEPFFFESDKKQFFNKVKNIVNTGNLTQGKYNINFEECCKKSTKAKYAISVNSGGTALELALLSLINNKKNIDVVVPTETFVATASAVVRAGANPIFSDISSETLNMSLESLKKVITKKTKIVIFVHMFGIMTDEILKIKKYLKKKSIYLIEDAAHAHGASINKKYYAGNIGDLGCFSFYATKILTTGEGGIITTNNTNLAKKIFSIRNHGKHLKENKIINIGNNFRLPEISALMGTYQYKRLGQFIKHRRKIASIYRKELSVMKHLRLIDPSPHLGHSYWRYPIILNKNIDRKKFQLNMRNNGIRICYKVYIYFSTYCKFIVFPLANK